MRFKSGFAAILGKTNVGKSTLFNSLLGQKVSIVSEKPQTTRNRILGVYTDRECQIVFVDTPGIHREQQGRGLNRFMMRTALSAKEDADVIALMIEVASSPDDLDEAIIRRLSDTKLPVILLINKIDTVRRDLILPLIDRLQGLATFHAIIPISALKGDGVGEFLREIKDVIPEGQPYFPEDTLTDQTERFIVGEIIREKVFSLTRQELPYSTAVVVEKFTDDDTRNLLSIAATVFVERDSQKGIMIGRGGGLIKNIGIAARRDIEAFFDTHVFLDLRVKVMKDWAKNEETIKRLGYT
jgi:GTP-binding protein Era